MQDTYLQKAYHMHTLNWVLEVTKWSDNLTPTHCMFCFMLLIWGADLSQDWKWKLITWSHPVVHVEQQQLGLSIKTSDLLSLSDILSDFVLALSVSYRRISTRSTSPLRNVFFPLWRRGRELELLVRSACPRAYTALTAEKLVQTTGQMCFIWLYLLTHPVCVACEGSITQQHQGQRQRHQTEIWTQREHFSLHCCLTPQWANIPPLSPHEEKYLVYKFFLIQKTHLASCLSSSAWVLA